ncbi:hypothetical protein HDU93_000301 [Gonapodya sp. JEL0774]|nr:hypothetical protein HDU93_000301 [Gonapodya sp. JEL0774]
MKRKNQNSHSSEGGDSGQPSSGKLSRGDKKRRREKTKFPSAQDIADSQQLAAENHDAATCDDPKCTFCGDGEIELRFVVRRQGGEHHGHVEGSEEKTDTDTGTLERPSATDLLKLALSEKSLFGHLTDSDYPYSGGESGEIDADPARADRESHRSLVQKLFEAANESFERELAVSPDVGAPSSTDSFSRLDLGRLHATCLRELATFVRSEDILEDAITAYEHITRIPSPDGMTDDGEVYQWNKTVADAWGGLGRTLMALLSWRLNTWPSRQSDSDDDDDSEPDSFNLDWLFPDEPTLVNRAVKAFEKSRELPITSISETAIPRLIRESTTAAREMQEFWLSSLPVRRRRQIQKHGESSAASTVRSNLLPHLTSPFQTLRSNHSDRFTESPEARFLYGRGMFLSAKHETDQATALRDVREGIEHLQYAAESEEVGVVWHWLALALLHLAALLPPNGDSEAAELVTQAAEALAKAVEEDPGNEEAQRMLEGMLGADGVEQSLEEIDNEE